MKKYYKFGTFLVLVSSFALPAFAQTSGPISCTNLQLIQGTCVAPSSNQPSYCQTNTIPTVSTPPTYLQVQQCDQSGNCSVLNSDYTASLDTATALAKALGATVVANNNPLGDASFTYSAPEYELVFPNGTTANAGALAKDFQSGFVASGSNQFLQNVCGSGLSGTGTGTGSNTGTNNGNNTINNTGSVTDIIRRTLDNLQSILNKITGGPISTPVPTGTKVVTVDLLNVRTSPSTTAPLIKQFRKGDTFITTGAVSGESVEGVSQWWIIGTGINPWYAWSGGTSQ